MLSGFAPLIVWLCLALFALFSKFAPLRSQILKRGSFDLFVRISAMQIIGSGQIATSLHLSYQHFLAALRFLIFSFCLALLLFLFYSLEYGGGFRSCGSDHGLCPLDSHKPLIKAKPVFAAAQTFLRKASRLERNFYMGCALYLRPRRKRFLQLTANSKPPPPKKIKRCRTFKLSL